MAGDIEIKVDATRALARMDRLPVQVRDNLRRVLPPLIKSIAARVENKLGTQLKSRATLNVRQEMHDTAEEIYGTVKLESPSAHGLLPTYLERGTSPHEIVGNPVLAFQWDFMGAYGGSGSANTTQAFFRKVHHPGTRAYAFMSGTFAEMRDEIVQKMQDAARQGARNA